jgi:hypothetical protein
LCGEAFAAAPTRGNAFDFGSVGADADVPAAVAPACSCALAVPRVAALEVPFGSGPACSPLPTLPFGVVLAPFGVVLTPFGVVLAPFGVVLAPFGVVLAPFGVVLAPFGVVLAPFGVVLARFGVVGDETAAFVVTGDRTSVAVTGPRGGAAERVHHTTAAPSKSAENASERRDTRRGRVTPARSRGSIARGVLWLNSSVVESGDASSSGSSLTSGARSALASVASESMMPSARAGANGERARASSCIEA